jgi:hypothetical protein
MTVIGDRVIVTYSARTRGVDSHYGWKQFSTPGTVTHVSAKVVWVKLDGAGWAKSFRAEQVKPLGGL